jgi:hypothetical protein
MPVAIRAVVAFNIAASIVVVFVAYSFGGGFSPASFPPEREIVLELVEAPPAPLPSDPLPTARPTFAIPAEFSRPEPMAPRWETQPEGSVRLLD